MADRNQLLNDPEEALRIALDGRQATMWTALPGIVTGVDFTTMTLSVQPAIQGTVTDENGNIQSVNLPLLIHVPIQYPSAGGFSLTLPVAVNDEVLIVWASRCIDAWWQSGGIQRPMEQRMHDMSDGFAILGIRSVPNVIPSISTTAAQLRNDAGTSYFEVSADGKVKVVSPSEIDLTGPVKIVGDVTLTGKITMTGDIAVTGKIDATGEIKSGLIPLTTHKHTGVTVGSGTSGTPVP